jgi:poly(A) polymerase
MDLFDVGSDPGPRHGIYDHRLEPVTTDTAATEDADGETLFRVFMNTLEPAVFLGYGLPVLFEHGGGDVILFPDRTEDKGNGLGKIHVGGQGLVGGNIKSNQTDDVVADLDHPWGGAIHIGSDVVRKAGNERDSTERKGLYAFEESGFSCAPYDNRKQREMKEERENNPPDLCFLRDRLARYPQRLILALARVSSGSGQEFFVIGGTVRDWLLGRIPGDLDLTVACDAVSCCRALIAALGGGAFVPLGCAEEDAGRVVWQGLTVDFSSFRQGARTIEEDLGLRDYTINSMGVSLAALLGDSAELRLLDPLGGAGDLDAGILRACPHAFAADPLRMLRGYRLRAVLGFAIEAATAEEIARQGALIRQAAVERISHELDLIMASERAHTVIGEMAGSGLLWQIIPELASGVGLEQPGFHHLDVFHHSLAALGFMEEILAAPERFYPGSVVQIREYLGQPGVAGRLKWAALLHDLGKPMTMAVREDKDGRITFYNHDQAGKGLVLNLGREMRWGNEDRERVADLVGMHMQPFHLCNVRRDGPLSRKACLNLSKKAGDDLIGLFLLAMADSLAGQGEKKPPAMEAELAGLLDEVLKIHARYIQPVISGPRLLTGQDLISSFSLTPGPLFARILDGLQIAQVEGEIASTEDAHRWVRCYLDGSVV